MNQFRPIAFRPYVPYHSPTLGAQGHKQLAQTFDDYLKIGPAAGDVLRLVFHGIAVYLGVWVGLNAKHLQTKNKTVKKATVILGWVLAGGQGLGALADVISLAQRALGTHPPEPATMTVEHAVAPVPPVLRPQGR